MKANTFVAKMTSLTETGEISAEAQEAMDQLALAQEAGRAKERARRVLKTEEKYGEFLRRLSALSVEFDITIGGCGCCGSPSLSEEKCQGSGRYVVDDGGGNLTWKD